MFHVNQIKRAVYPISVGLLLFLIIGCHVVREPADIVATQRACNYLWNTQSEDGGWHSETHGILRGGESISPFIFVALMNVPEEVYKPSTKNVNLALNFIRNNVRNKLSSETVPQIVDYPNYTAAYALKALVTSNTSEDSLLVRQLTEYLVTQQFTEERGIDSTHTAYGGWGFGEYKLAPGTVGHVDISHTRRVLEALRLTLPPDHYAFRRAQRYLGRVQNDLMEGDTLDPAHLDGGFFTSIVTSETNKSLPVPGMKDTWYSYATATCDGLLALRAAGVDLHDTRVLQAKTWLEKHQELRFPEGIPPDDPMQWHTVMKYYHLAVRAEAHGIFNDHETFQRISEILISEQRRDGSFINPMGAPNKEDDPLLATAFGLIAFVPGI